MNKQLNIPPNPLVLFALSIAATLLAFWKSYFTLIGHMPETMGPSVHIHAMLMFLWLLMLVAQAWFIKNQKLRAHKLLGRASFLIAPLIFIFSVAAQHHTFRRPPVGNSIEEVFRLQILGFGMMIGFALTWVLAMAYVRRPALHIRFIISTLPAVASAIVWRIFYFWIPGCDADEPSVIGNGSVIMIGLFVLIVMDWRKGVRLSPYWVVTIVQGVGHVGFWSFARSDWYYAFCRWFTALPITGGPLTTPIPQGVVS